MSKFDPPAAQATISVVGAFDRHNYGDLLFPLIVERAVRDLGIDADIDFYATADADMSAYGGKRTKSVRKLFARAPAANEKVVVAGGEVLPAKWALIYSYLVSPVWARVVNRLSALVGDRVSSALIAKLLGSRSVLPFVYAPEDFARKVDVVYNAVGGSHVKDEGAFIRRELLSKLRGAAYVSVRDQETFNYLKSNGIGDVRLSPDCAILLSRLYPLAQLQGEISQAARRLQSACAAGYVCVQSAAAYVQGNEDKLRRSLRRIRALTGLDVVVFAIGRATGHSDQRTFDVFRSNGVIEEGVHISECDSVNDIIWLIANSKAYIGTSLHGAITSASYGVPVLGLCPSRVNKLPAFLNTWADPMDFQVAEFDAIDTAFDALWASRRSGRSAMIERAQDVALQNFRNMLLPDG